MGSFLKKNQRTKRKIKTKKIYSQTRTQTHMRKIKKTQKTKNKIKQKQKQKRLHTGGNGDDYLTIPLDELYPNTTNESRLKTDDSISEIISFLGILDIVQYLTEATIFLTTDEVFMASDSNKSGIYIENHGINEYGEEIGVHFMAIINGRIVDSYDRGLQKNNSHGFCQIFAMRAFLNDEAGLKPGKENYSENTHNNLIWVINKIKQKQKLKKNATKAMKAKNQAIRTDIFEHNLWETSLNEAAQILTTLSQNMYAIDAIANAFANG